MYYSLKVINASPKLVKAAQAFVQETDINMWFFSGVTSTNISLDTYDVKVLNSFVDILNE